MVTKTSTPSPSVSPSKVLSDGGSPNKNIKTPSIRSTFAKNTNDRIIRIYQRPSDKVSRESSPIFSNTNKLCDSPLLKSGSPRQRSIGYVNNSPDKNRIIILEPIKEIKHKRVSSLGPISSTDREISELRKNSPFTQKSTKVRSPSVFTTPSISSQPQSLSKIDQNHLLSRKIEGTASSIILLAADSLPIISSPIRTARQLKFIPTIVSTKKK